MAKTGRSGAPNKNKAFLMNRLKDLYGDDFHPILKIAGNCVTLQSEVDEIKVPDIPKNQTVKAKEKRANALVARSGAIQRANHEWARIAEYTEPKLKAVQVDLNSDMEGLVLEMHYGGKTVSTTKIKTKAKAKPKKSK